MSLNNISFPQIVLKQTKWKFLTYSQALLALVVIQVIFSLLLSNAGGSGWYTVNTSQIEVGFYSLDGVVIFGGMWAFITGLLFQTKAYRYDDYSIVTNRLTASVANIIVLVIYSFIGTVLSILTFYLNAGLLQLFSEKELVRTSFMLIAPLEVAVSFIIVLLAGSIGYFLSSAFQLSKWVALGVIAVFVFVVSFSNDYLLPILLFFYEDGYLLFIVKGSIVSALLFVVSVVLLSRKEVER